MGMKLRIHPMGAALARCQLNTLDKQTEMERQQNHSLNSRFCQLPGIYEQAAGPGVKRVYWASNHLFIDAAEAGMSRDTVVKALKAEGVSIRNFGYTVSHRDVVYREPQWWHHPPVIPDRFAGKVWAHRAELGRV